MTEGFTNKAGSVSRVPTSIGKVVMTVITTADGQEGGNGTAEYRDQASVSMGERSAPLVDLVQEGVITPAQLPVLRAIMAQLRTYAATRILP